MATRSTGSAWAVGGSTFAACMMIMVGFWQVMVGIAAIAKGDFFVAGANYLYKFDTTTWGWIHLIVGALALLAGFFIFTDAAWARGVGIGLAAVSATTQFFWLPYQPLWSLAIIALDVFVIWSLLTVGGAMREEREADEEAARGGQWSTMNSQGDPTLGGNPPRTAPDAAAQARAEAEKATGQPPL